MELDFDKYCKLGRSPRTVLPSKNQSKSRKGRHSSKNEDCDWINLERDDFTGIKFRNYRSVSCKNPPSDFECNEVLKRRGSVYQSSTNRNPRRSETRGGRKKVEYSLNSETPFSFSILDSICGSDEEVEAEPEQHRSPIISRNADSIILAKPPSQLCSMKLKDRQKYRGTSSKRNSMENEKYPCEQVGGPSSNANILEESDSLALNKSLSAKLAMPHSPIQSEGNSTKGTPKTLLRKMFDPFTKYRSHPTPSNDAKSSSLDGVRKTKTLPKSLLHDFSSAVPSAESGTPPVKKEEPEVVLRCSAAHLRGNLKEEQKHGVPYYEFTMENAEVLLMAKTWKAENALNWVYTFHTIQGRKRSNASGSGITYSKYPMIGQMQVTSCLCSELRGSGALSNTMMTEFVLYDIAHARNSVTIDDDNNCPENSNVLSILNEHSLPGNINLDNFSKSRLPVTSVVDHSREGCSSPYPWAPADLHPSFEIAAMVVEAPFDKRERPEGDKLSDQVAMDRRDDSNVVKVNVVTPLGNHGLPTGGECKGASPLLDRWRSGGGCDCGGWDMSCSLAVFGTPKIQRVDEQLLLQKDQPLELYVQGGKENKPALCMTITEKGRYTIDFHAKLSALQAFAVCVAILHTTEASGLVEQEKYEELRQSSSLKVFVKDIVKTEEENQKAIKIAEGHQPSFGLNPPFSPMARV